MSNARARARQLSVTRPWRERKPIGPVGAALTAEQGIDFWARVGVATGEHCWPWSRAVDGRGYGHLVISNKHLRAHRVAYELSFGAIPNGLLVCHSCDNRLCCNPSHLFLGTHADNTRDMISKGREARGERHGTKTRPDSVRKGERVHFARLTAQDVSWMRWARGFSGAEYEEIGEAFGVSGTTALRACSGITWRSVSNGWEHLLPNSSIRPGYDNALRGHIEQLTAELARCPS